jgi:hypothetical protein
MAQQRQREQNYENKEQYLRYPGGSQRDSSKAQDGCNQRYNEEN